MDMHDPAHPGEILAGWIDDLDLSVTAFAKHLGISTNHAVPDSQRTRGRYC